MGFFDIFSNKNAQDAANAQADYAQQGYRQLSQLFGQGQNALQTNYTAALAPFLQAQQTGQQGTQALSNALGFNGPQGNALATQGFWNNPAIQSQLNLGSQNVLRNQAASGQLASGATNIDLQNLAQQTASQGWNQYINSLTPFLGYNLGSATGGANVQTGLGNQLNQSLMQQGNAAYGMNASIGNAFANADLAKNTASANMMNSLTSMLGPGASLLSSGIGALGGLFGAGAGAGAGAAGAGGGLADAGAALGALAIL